MPKQTDIATIISQQELAPGVFSMWLKTDIAGAALSGQFINVYSKDSSKLLPRPISICEIDYSGRIRIVYRVNGEGTKEFSGYKDGDRVKIMGPLGNGFYNTVMQEKGRAGKTSFNQFSEEDFDYGEESDVLIIGGGIGIPPMLGLAKALKCRKHIVVGYRSDRDMFLTRELTENGSLYIATDDGSFGTGGTVIDCIRENGIKADAIFACGPKPMLKGVKTLGEEWNVPTFISMEERMACGVGACLGCVCKTTETDDHSKVHNKRVCADGPVFLAGEVEL